MIALIHIQTDNINQMKTIAKSNLLMISDLWLSQFDHINQMISLSVITLSRFYCVMTSETFGYLLPATKINIVLCFMMVVYCALYTIYKLLSLVKIKTVNFKKLLTCLCNTRHQSVHWYNFQNILSSSLIKSKAKHR